MKDLKVKVEPYNEECTHYVVYYSYNNGVTWELMVRNFLSEKIRLCEKELPVFFTDFDKAVKYAKDLTVEKIEQHQKQMNAEYDEYMEKLNSEIQKRNKVFIS